MFSKQEDSSDLTAEQFALVMEAMKRFPNLPPLEATLEMVRADLIQACQRIGIPCKG